MSRALFGGLKPTLHYCGDLGRRGRLELSMVSPELVVSKGLLMDFGQRGVIQKTYKHRNNGGARPTLLLGEVRSFIRKPYIHS